MIRVISKKNWGYLPFIFLTTLIVCSAAILNGYPLMFSDSAGYISSGFEKNAGMLRPIIYGLFIYVFSGKESLWYVLFIQSFILAYLLTRFSLLFLESKKYIYTIGVMIFLALFTGMSFYASQIMTDVFTSIAFLAIVLLLFYRRLLIPEQIFLYILLLFSILTHKSHFLLFSVFFVAVLVFYFSNSYMKRSIILRRFILVGIVIIGSWFSAPLVNYAYNSGKYKMQSAAHVFYMGRLTYTGMLQRILDDICDEKEGNKLCLCKYKNNLPESHGAFLWHAGSPLYRCGGWKNSEKEFNEIIKYSFSKPEYIAWHLKSSVFSYFRQIIEFNGSKIFYTYKSAERNISKHFKYERNQYVNSLQYNEQPGNSTFLAVFRAQYLLIILSVFFLLFIFGKKIIKRFSYQDRSIIIFVILILLINPAVTSIIAGVSERYQGKIIWLLPFVLLLLIYKYYNIIIQKFRSYF